MPSPPKVKRNGETRVPRLEWEIWKWIAIRSERLGRVPSFSDYGIDHPIPMQLEHARAAVTLRYTQDDHWLVMKKSGYSRQNARQFFDICGDLVARDEFSGRELSLGDQFIAAAARRDVNPGYPRKWRLEGLSHHLAFVERQVGYFADAIS